MSLATQLPPVPAAPAARLRAPSWRDPRLLVGLLLVLAAVLLGARVVAAADSTAPVWVAARTLVPGDVLTADDLRAVDVHVDGGAGSYLSAGEAPPAGTVVLREVTAGDLLPRSALGAAAQLTTRPVGLPVTGALPSGLVAGALVDVWVTPAPERAAVAVRTTPVPAGGATTPDGEPATDDDGPRQLAAGAVVAEVVTEGGSFASGRGATVQVALDPVELREALRAVAADAEVSLVLVPGSSPVGG